MHTEDTEATEATTTEDTTVLDREALDRDIEAGAKAFRELLRNADLDWTHWSATILGMRGLRSLAYAKAGTLPNITWLEHSMRCVLITPLGRPVEPDV